MPHQKGRQHRSLMHAAAAAYPSSSILPKEAPDGCIVQIITDGLDAHVLNGDTPGHLA